MSTVLNQRIRIACTPRLVYPLAPPAIAAKSYIDDVHLIERHATITGAGMPGMILLDLSRPL